MCHACYSWWRNISLYTAGELTSYMGWLEIRTDRYNNRSQMLSGPRKSLPTIRHKK
jgi:hypothetical protein